MTILFTICGRAGSKGFKNKNVKEMNGVPLVYYTLAAIKGYADRHGEDDIRVAVNTDSKELKDIIKAQKAVCGIEYVPGSGISKYCPVCAKKMQREKSNESKRRSREQKRMACIELSAKNDRLTWSKGLVVWNVRAICFQRLKFTAM